MVLNHKKKWLAAIFFVFVFLVLSVIVCGLRNNTFNADLIVVLGNKVFPDGDPSEALVARLNEAIRIYDDGYAPYILVSGGTGIEGHDESVVMKQYLIDHGIPEKNIINDGKGVNTRATAQNTAIYMNDHHMKCAIVISQYYHIARIKLAFNMAGVKCLGNAAPFYFTWEDFVKVPREMMGYVFYYFRLK
ncbi:YdcF family protein [Commensalibacter oyaizuii]|uniref:YdcF family protein n=1 Tax=Commensalibacter oyaizuii TaxID=3043873 RepID=A0ABT6Q021_9PROT|nr:YdcF family protein [Commensalibacter sp. TBRC 16381]MDI2090469.1 YdcF family protein [Commensalibacter sp. TBRC 16381]